MFDQVYMMKQLDALRRQKKISIEQLTEKIVTKRSYHRYTTGEVTITFDKLNQMLNRLMVSISDFSYFLHNQLVIDYNDEYKFVDYISDKQYQHAYDTYYLKIKDSTMHSIYASKSMPIAIDVMNYKLEKSTLHVAYKHSKEVIDLPFILKKSIITDDDITALKLFSDLCTEDDELILIEIYKRMMIKNEYKIYITHYESMTLAAYHNFLKILTRRKVLRKEDHELISLVISKALEFASRAMLANFDFLILKEIYEYKTKYKLEKENVIFYYFSTLLSLTEDILKSVDVKIEEEDLIIYEKHIRERKYVNKRLYEELIDETHI